MNKEIISIIVGIVIVVVAIIFVYYKKKNSPNEKDKKDANNFLDGLKGILFDKCTDIINNFNYKDYDNLADIEIDIINLLIDECKKYIADELEKSTDILSYLALKCLTTDVIEDFILSFINSLNIFEKANNLADISNKENIDNIISEDKELIEEFSDTEKYNDIEMEELPKAEEIKYSEEELSKLNPQVDEEESYNPEDESMEIIDDKQDKEKINDDDIYIDATGRAHSTSTGKFVKRIKNN